MSSRPLLSWLLPVFVVLVACPLPLAAEQQCLTKAWSCLKKGDYDKAIEAADSCIDEFDLQANKEEAKLKSAPASCSIHSEAGKREIFARGVLNDVAAALIVKGKATEAAAKKGVGSTETKAAYTKMAIETYEKATAYRHACVWDPDQGSFWSPSDYAADRLIKLRGDDGGTHHR